MVLEVFISIGVTVVAGLVVEFLGALFRAAEREDQQTRIKKLENELSELKRKRSTSRCCHIFTFLLLSVFLIASAALLHLTDFFPYKRGLVVLLRNRFSNGDDYYGIAAVVIFIVVGILSLLFLLCKNCFGIMRIEKQLKDVENELKNTIGRGGDN